MEGSNGGALAAGVITVTAALLSLVLVVVLLVAADQDDRACAAVTSAVNLPAAPAAVANPSAPAAARVASWNTLYANSTSRVVAGLETITKSADVIGVQELQVTSRRDTVARALGGRGWAVSDGNNAVQIFYNAEKYKLLAEGSEKVFGFIRIEGGTAGTSIGPKSVQWVQLQDRATGGVFFTVNHHIVPDIDRSGHPRPNAPKRLAAYRTQMSAMLSVVAKLRLYGPVAVTGDFNVDAKADRKVHDATFPYAVMGRSGLTANWTALGLGKTASHGSRWIDYVWLTTGAGTAHATFTSQHVLGAYGSDHRAVVAAFRKDSTSNTTTSNTDTTRDTTSGDTTNRPNTGTTANGPAASTPAAGGAAPKLPASLSVPGLTLDAEQIAIAATAISVGKQFNIPDRGWVVAIASGLQESGLRNLNGGDLDSLGWQQQRPASGWGTPAQIRDVRLATMAFYGVATHTNNPGLTDIAGWQQMSITQAAQAVQRSAFPDAYAKHEPAARAIVAQLAPLLGAASSITAAGADCPGQAPAGSFTGNCPPTGLASEKDLKPDALLVMRCAKIQFPALTTIGGVRADSLPDHPSGRAVDLMIPNYQTAAGKAFGWQIANWVRSYRKQLGVQYVIFDNKIWNIERDDEGWRVYNASGQGDDSSLHYNHVHVTVYGNTAQPDGPATNLAAGPWVLPLGNPHTVGCSFHGCYSAHTGQDFPAPPGTPVYAVTSGTITRSESITTTGTCTTLPICGGTKKSYGNLIVIRLAGGGNTTAYYAHLTARLVTAGQTVTAGQLIGTVGYQGNVKPPGPGGSHLHFEIRNGGTATDPIPFLRGKGVNPK